MCFCEPVLACVNFESVGISVAHALARAYALLSRVNTLTSLLHVQVLREKCRCDVLRDAVCQPRASLSDIFWQWLRGRFGLKSLALEIRARVLHTAAGLRLASRFLDGGPVSPPSLLATLFMSLYANGSDVGSGACAPSPMRVCAC